MKNISDDPEHLYDACEFGNESYHDIAFRVTKADGLDFVPSHGVLKPQERVPLRFQMRRSYNYPSSVEIEILSIRVSSDTPGRIENKWRLVPSNRVSRIRHRINLQRETDSRSDGTAATSPKGKTSSLVSALSNGSEAGVKPSSPEPTPTSRNATPPAKKCISRASQASYPTPAASTGQDLVMEGPSLFNVTNVVLAVLAAIVVYLVLQVRALWDKVENKDDFCSGRFCIWFLCH